MKNLKIFTLILGVGTAYFLAAPFFDKKNGLNAQQKYDYNIEILLKTRLEGTSIPVKNMDVTLTALDIGMDVQSQTLPLDNMGGGSFY